LSFKKLQIPSLETVKDGIRQILSEEKWDAYKIKGSPQLFEKRLNELFIGNLKLMIQLVYLGTDKSIPKKFYRLRKQTRTFNEKLISEYSYPPNHFVKTIQRANIPYHPVFYCSDNPSTAIMETVKGEESLNTDFVYYMSEWETKNDQDIKVCPFIFDNVSETNPYKVLSEINKSKLFEVMKEHTDDEKNAMLEILKFLSNLFIEDDTYVVSSYLAYLNLYANHNFRPDIFIYPSVQTNRDTVNFAIHPNSVIEKLRLKRVFKMRLKSFNETTRDFTVTINWVGQNNNGIIQWRQVNPDSEDGKQVVKELEELFRIS